MTQLSVAEILQRQKDSHIGSSTHLSKIEFSYQRSILVSQKDQSTTSKEASLTKEEDKKNDCNAILYLLSHVIGKGAFSYCFATNHSSIVIKMVYKKRKGLDDKCHQIQPLAKKTIDREIKVHSSLHHPCIIRLYQVKESKECTFFMLEKADQTLHSYIKQYGPLSLGILKVWIYQLIQVLHYLHNTCHIIHRDLKPDNILINFDENCIKLSDFGFSIKNEALDWSDPKKTHICGTPNYFSPEMIQGQQYDYHTDLWSLGVLIFYVSTRRLPFESNNIDEMGKKIVSLSYCFYEHEKIDPNVIQIVDSLLQKNPNQRVSLAKLANHPFFR